MRRFKVFLEIFQTLIPSLSTVLCSKSGFQIGVGFKFDGLLDGTLFLSKSGVYCIPMAD